MGGSSNGSGNGGSGGGGGGIGGAVFNYSDGLPGSGVLTITDPTNWANNTATGVRRRRSGRWKSGSLPNGQGLGGGGGSIMMAA